MKIYIFRRWQVTLSGLLLTLFAVSLIAAIQIRTIERRIYGVKRGVFLENRSVAGLLPGELDAVVRSLAMGMERPPHNAMLYAETGQIVPERAGLAVDVAATVQAVRQARAGSRLRLVTRPVQAAVTKDYFTPVFRGSADRAEVALTFNVAWGEESLPALLDILQREQVKATFYFVGEWAEKFPDLLRTVAADGHEIANHGKYHGRPVTLDRAALAKMILDNDQLLAKITGRPPAKLFAPPSGEFDQRTVGIAAELGFRTVLWTVDTIDWQRPAPDLIRSRVAKKICNGAIVLMHPTAPTVAALPDIIRDLRAKGYTMVTVGQLLRAS